MGSVHTVWSGFRAVSCSSMLGSPAACGRDILTSVHRHKVMLQPIYDKLSPEITAALINWHALTGCDTTGHIQGKGKKGCLSHYLMQVLLY